MRSRIPKPIRHFVRNSLLDPFQLKISDWRLGRSVRSFRSSLEPNREAIEKFRRAWGNESFSADVTYISEAISRVRGCTAPILECGSGITTLIAALALEGTDLPLWSLEQDQEWAEFVGSRLKKNNIRNVELRYAPLVELDGYVWYDISNIDMPKHFDLVLCDGPAVFEKWGDSSLQWRYGLLPALSNKGVYVKEILLDDAAEARAPNLLLRWEREFHMHGGAVQTADGDFAVVARVNEALSIPFRSVHQTRY